MITTPAIARSAAKNTELALKPVDKPYAELGSIEGIARGVDVDGHGRRLLNVRHRLTGDVIKCILHGQALEVIGRHTVGDVFQGLRVHVHGTIRYRSLGHISQVEATEILFARPRADLPSIDDILDETFTGGLKSEDYLERLRDGNALKICKPAHGGKPMPLLDAIAKPAPAKPPEVEANAANPAPPAQDPNKPKEGEAPKPANTGPEVPPDGGESPVRPKRGDVPQDAQEALAAHANPGGGDPKQASVTTDPPPSPPPPPTPQPEADKKT